ncbi:benzoate 4-monooxygenase cytochrome P450 [Xylaria sp. CBS 124048]|nr:benzoate 4-monooxygenase cytochrome P450 [Xylaria sp. CBS 124048]
MIKWMLGQAVLAVCVKTIYNVFLHPLRKYPGPLLARASRLYYAYHLLRGNYATVMIKLHAEYGPVLRIAPDELSYSCPEAWQDVYGQTFNGRKADLEKDRTFYMAPPNGVDSIITAPFHVHQRLRRLTETALSERALSAQEDIIQGYVDSFIQRVRETVSDKQNTPIDLGDWVTFLCFDVLGDLGFGESFHNLENGKAHWWIITMQNGAKAALQIKTLERFLPGLSSLLMLVLKIVGMAMAIDPDENFNFCARRARERLARDSTRPDFISHMANANKKNMDMSPAELEANAQTLINAGAEPVSAAVCGVIYHLLRDEQALEKAVKEVRSSFASPSDITMSSTQKLSYLTAAIDEGIRLYPPSPGTFPRTTPPGGCVIYNQYVPGGYSVGINQNAIMRSERNWVEPTRFCPERWLGDKRFDGDLKKAYHPFSFGPRSCLGKSLALSETRLILSKLLWHFELGLAPESFDWIATQKTNMFWESGPLMVSLKPASR